MIKLSGWILLATLLCSACTTQPPVTVSAEEKLCRELSPTGCLSHLGIKNFSKLDRLAMLMSVGKWHLAQSQPEKARDYFGMLTQLDRYNGPAHRLLGDSFFAEALEDQREPGALGKMMSEVYFAAAAASYTSSFEIDPKDTQAYLGAIRGFSQSGKCDLAKDILALYEKRFGDTADSVEAVDFINDKCAG